MKAKYDGRCRKCSGDIVADEHEITRADDGDGWMHVDCDDAEGSVSQSTALSIACNDSAPDIVREEAEAILRGGATRAHAKSDESNIVAAGGWCAPSRTDEIASVLSIPTYDGDSEHVLDAVDKLYEKAVQDLLSPDRRTRVAAVSVLRDNGMTADPVRDVLDIPLTDTTCHRCGQSIEWESERASDVTHDEEYIDFHADACPSDASPLERRKSDMIERDANGLEIPGGGYEEPEAVFLSTVDTACAGCGGEVIAGHHRVTDAPSGDTLTHVECVDSKGVYFGRPRFVPVTSPPTKLKSLRDDRWGRYTLMSPDGSGKAVTRSRASTVIKAHGDTYNLNEWSKRNVLRGAGANPSLAKLAASLDPDKYADKAKLNELVEKASDAGGGSDAANRGTALHAFCEAWETTGSMEGIPEEDAADVRAYAEALARHGLTVVPDMIERTTMTSRWDGVAGTFDNIYRTRDGRYVIGDKKTGKVGYDLAKMYGQFAMYAEGVHEYGVYDPDTGLWSLPDFDIDLSVALIIHLPAGTGTCFVYEADLTVGREHLNRCARVRRERNETKGLKKVPYAAPARAGGVDWARLLTESRSTYELRALFSEIDAAGDMTDALKSVGNDRWATLTGGAG